MNTPVARKLAAADARRVAGARAARAAAASRRVAAAKRRMLTLSVLGALTLSGWVLTALVAFPWIVPTLMTALTVTVVELGRRAAAAGARADAELAKRVQLAEAKAGIGRVITAEPQNSQGPDERPETVDMAEELGAEVGEPASSLRVEVDPTLQEASTWTPVPVPPPAYTLKAEVRRKIAEPYEPGVETEESIEAREVTNERSAQARVDSVPAVAAAPEASEVTSPEKNDLEKAEPPRSPEQAPAASETTGTLNVQEILARRRAVG